jgi:glycosyltransferase involved in cell wall biosynthesis
MSDRPLVTLFVFAYRQEHFIRDAIAGALTQTYSPLEIILSDDCSPDGTYAVMEEMAAAYRGPHQVRLNRNPTNLRVALHLNAIYAMATGELIIVAAGDDISLPQRAEVLARYWLAGGRAARSLYSEMEVIDADGRPTGASYSGKGGGHSENIVEAAARHRAGVPGCTQAISRDVLDVFGPLPADVVNEDEVLGFRSLLLGSVLHVPEVLIRYRRHESNVSGRSGTSWRASDYREKYRRRAVAHRAVFDAWLRDLETARTRQLRPASMLDEAERGIREHLRYLDLELRLVGMSTPRAVLETLRLAFSARQRRSAARAFVRTQLPMPLRILSARAFGSAPVRAV